MTLRLRRAVAVFAALSLAAAVGSGCSSETAGTPTAAVEASVLDAASSTETTSADAVAPTGPPVGTATMKVIGGGAPVTLRYQINGGPEQTETDVTLPWEKQYQVYDEVETSVTADGGDADLTCTITMDGKLLSFKTEPRPTCSFSYWG